MGEDDDPKVMNGSGNKAISLKLSILNRGHFALLATGVDNLTIDNVKVDTNRDGFDIDSCRNVRISNCSVNSPNDDAIVLKSSYARGWLSCCVHYRRSTRSARAYWKAIER
ncbi:MAG TPA: glycosyl hydrolase family 28 protein [Pyrinomonadaceae bacterium]|nr:glycosyl hydrolase family 28 protein [Pyrinomonadaceae bacterium]